MFYLKSKYYRHYLVYFGINGLFMNQQNTLDSNGNKSVIEYDFKDVSLETIKIIKMLF